MPKRKPLDLRDPNELEALKRFDRLLEAMRYMFQGDIY